MKFFFTTIQFALIVSFFAFLPETGSAQEKMGNETLALEYFKEGDFEKALPLFAQLIRNNPDDPMYNYYYGVSLVKNNIFETAAKEALLNAVVDRTPANSNFYMGNYFHALGEWHEALDFYDRFDGLGSRQERKALNLDYFVDLCKKKINPFEVKTAANQNTVFTDTIKKVTTIPDDRNFPIPEELTKAWFNFQVNEVLVYHMIDDFKSEAGKVLFTKAWVLTGQNDSIVSVTDSLRKEHEKTVRVSTRLELVQQIVDGEQKSYQLIRDREKLFEQARAKESVWWEKAGESAVNEFKAMQKNREDERAARLKQEREARQAVTPPLSQPVAQQTEYVEPPQTSAQEIKAESTADNIVYKVQIGSFRNGALTASFKSLHAKLSKLRKIDQYTDNRKYEIYTVGSFSKYKDVQQLKEQLVLEGAKGAFVVAYRNGEKIPVTEAVKITGGE